MNPNSSDIVRIYFVDPIDILSVIISTLVEMEYESYVINLNDKDNLLKILQNDVRNVLFICIKNHTEIAHWLEYVKKIKQIENPYNLIGAFIYNKMMTDDRNKFLEENVAMIELSEISKNTLQIMRKILTFFEAKSKKGYISTKTYGISEVYYYLPDFKEPIIGKMHSVSAFAFTCEINSMYKTIFAVNTVIKDSLLVLNGTRVNASLKVVGFSRENPNIYMFKYCSIKIENTKMITIDKIEPETKRKVHNYIKWCLKEDIKLRLNALSEEKKT